MRLTEVEFKSKVLGAKNTFDSCIITSALRCHITDTVVTFMMNYKADLSPINDVSIQSMRLQE